MSSKSVILLPGAWEVGDTSMQLARAVAGITGGLPFDIHRRMLAHGFAVNGTSAEVAARCARAIEELDAGAQVIDDPGVSWHHPEVHFATRVSIARDLIQYDSGGKLHPIKEEDLYFIQVGCVPQQKGKAGSTGTDAIVQLEGGRRARQLRIDIYLRNPRQGVGMNLGRTKYSFPDHQKTGWDFDRRAQVLKVLSTWAGRLPVLPDPGLLLRPLKDDAWERAEHPGEEVMRHKAAWYYLLAEHGFLETQPRKRRKTTRPQARPKPSQDAGSEEEEALLAALAELMDASETDPELAGASEATSGRSQEHAQKRPAAAAPPETLAPAPTKRPAAPGDAFSRHMQSARSWINRGMLNRALGEANLAVKLRPDSAEALELRSRLHEELGDDKAAIRDHMAAEAARRARGG